MGGALLITQRSLLPLQAVATRNRQRLAVGQVSRVSENGSGSHIKTALGSENTVYFGFLFKVPETFPAPSSNTSPPGRCCPLSFCYIRHHAVLLSSVLDNLLTRLFVFCISSLFFYASGDFLPKNSNFSRRPNTSPPHH